jgi:hypothetical protein
MGWGARNPLLSLVERLGLAFPSLHHELGPINKSIILFIMTMASSLGKEELPTLWTLFL